MKKILLTCYLIKLLSVAVFAGDTNGDGCCGAVTLDPSQCCCLEKYVTFQLIENPAMKHGPNLLIDSKKPKHKKFKYNVVIKPAVCSASVRVLKGKQSVKLDKSTVSHGQTLTVELIEDSAKPEDFQIEMEIQGGVGKCKKTFDGKVMQVDVLEVPKYLFGGAQHATPVKFEIKNAPDNVKIQKIKTRLNRGKRKLFSEETEKRFVANEGPSQANGTSKIYTVFVKSDSHKKAKNKLGSSRKSNDCIFVLDVEFEIVGKDKFKGVSDDEKDKEARPEIYADPALTVVDMYPVGKMKEKEVEVRKETQEEIDQDPVFKSFKHWATKRRGEGTLPHVDKKPVGGRNGFDVWDQKYTNEDDEISLFANLIDYGDFFGDGRGGEGFTNRLYGHMRAGYFYISYGGKEHEVLDAGEFAMDLNKETGQAFFEFFKGAKAEAKNVAEIRAGMKLDGLQKTVFDVLSGALIKGPWSTAFKVASDIFNELDKVEFSGKSSDGATEAVLYRGFNQVTIEGIVSNDSSFDSTSHVSSGTKKINTVQISGVRSAAVGDQFLLYISLGVACSAESIPFSTSDKIVSSRIVVTGDASSMSKMRLSARSN